MSINKPNYAERAKSILEKDVVQLKNFIEHWLADDATKLNCMTALDKLDQAVRTGINEHQKRLEAFQYSAPVLPDNHQVCPECKGKKMISSGLGTTICPKCRGTRVTMSPTIIVRPHKPPEISREINPGMLQHAKEIIEAAKGCSAPGCIAGFVGEFQIAPGGELQPVTKRPCPDCNPDSTWSKSGGQNSQA